MTVKDIIKICNGKLLCGDENIVCENFSKDTRTINNSDVYVGIKGDNFDGNLFYKDAIKNGASVCILDNEDVIKEKIGTIILVEDTILALGCLASYKRNLYDIPVIAITGSVGKTSVKDMIYEVLKSKYNVLCTKENYNNNIGVPLTILGLKNHDALIVEMGMNHMKELSYLSKIAKPTMAVITNIGTAHIGNLGSRENILKAKLEVLDGMNGGMLFINNDNDMLNKWAKEDTKYKKYTFGIEQEADVMAYNIKINGNNSTYNVKINNKEYTVNVPVSGKHFVYNSLCAIAVGNLLNIAPENIIKGIETFSLTKNRMEVDKIKDNITVINDAYNASYDSMKAAIEYLQNLPGNRKIAVLGDMFELGEFAEEIHRKVGIEVFTHKIDVLVTVGELAKYIADEVKYLGMPNEKVIAVDTTKEAIEYLNKNLAKDDVVLLKAAHGMNFVEIYNGIKE